VRLLWLILLCLAVGLPLAAREQRPRLLFLASYHFMFQTFDKQLRGLQEGLAASGIEASGYILDLEFMDTKRFPGPENRVQFAERLRWKLQSLPAYDILVVADDNALSFALAHKQSLFAEIPIVFLGVNDADLAASLDKDPQITGIVEAWSIDDTLQLMVDLFPRTSSIAVITDPTPSAKAFMTQLTRAMAGLDGVRLDVLDLSALSFEELAEVLRGFPPDQPILFMDSYVDRLGENWSFEKALAHAVENSPAPLFHLHDFGIGDGLLGGKVVSHWDQGFQAGRMAAQILAGTPPSALPVQRQSPNRYMFDYEQLQRHAIAPKTLPNEAVILNRPIRVWQSHPVAVVSAIVVVALLAGISVWLWVFERYRNRLNKRLKVVLKDRTRAMKEAQKADTMKTEFLATMSHELRTPLNAILGYSQMINQQVLGPLSNARYADYVRAIEASGRHLLDMVGDVLELSSFAMAEPREAERQQIYLPTLIEACLALTNQPDGARVPFLRIEPPPNLVLLGNERHLKQIVTNLLTNACKYSANVKAPKVELVFERHNGLSILVKDNGIGIAEDQAEQIFMPFFRGRNAESKACPGAGVGLAVCRQYAMQHGARLTVESGLGRGSTFRLHLPPERVIDCPAIGATHAPMEWRQAAGS